MTKDKEPRSRSMDPGRPSATCNTVTGPDKYRHDSVYYLVLPPSARKPGAKLGTRELRSDVGRSGWPVIMVSPKEGRTAFPQCLQLLCNWQSP